MKIIVTNSTQHTESCRIFRSMHSEDILIKKALIHEFHFIRLHKFKCLQYFHLCLRYISNSDYLLGGGIGNHSMDIKIRLDFNSEIYLNAVGISISIKIPSSAFENMDTSRHAGTHWSLVSISVPKIIPVPKDTGNPLRQKSRLLIRLKRNILPEHSY